MDITSKRGFSVIFVKLLLVVGIINHLVFLAIIFNICGVLNFTCNGDTATSEGMVYAFTLLVPQLTLEAFVVIGLLLSAFLHQLPSTNRSLIIIFLVTLAISLFVNYLT